MTKSCTRIMKVLQVVCMAALFMPPSVPIRAADGYSLTFSPFPTPGNAGHARNGTVSTAADHAESAGSGVQAASASTHESASEPQRWLRHPVSFELINRPLPEVLREFAARQGVAVRVSPSLSGTVSGTFAFTDPAEFLDVLCRVKHMNWYFDGGTVHFFGASEMESRLFTMAGNRGEELRRTMLELGIYDSRFEWRSADNGRLLMVQGPEVYISRVAEMLERMGEAEKAREEAEKAEEAARKTEMAERPREKQLGVFRLKHAWAAEKTITAGDTDTIVPGVADILQQILSEAPLPAKKSPVREGGAGIPRLIKGTGVIGRDHQTPPPNIEEPVEGTPFIQADTRINAVLVWDYEENLARYREIVAELDRPLELVEIRAAIVDVDTDKTKEIGFAWEYRGGSSRWDNNAGVNVGGNAADSAARPPYIPVVGDGLQYATIFRHGLDAFMARINLMEKDGDANTLSRPTVLTQDNIQAMLEYTDTFYVRLEGQDEVDLADIKTGITLKVTPHVISGDDSAGDAARIEGIQMAVHIVSGANTADTGVGMVDALPRVKQSSITTQAVVREGEALVIGGYYNETRSTAKTGVPGLSKIPGLGVLFRNKSDIANKSERLFVLSPRIVRLGETPPFSPGSEGGRILEHSPAMESLAAPALSVEDFMPMKTRRREEFRGGAR